MSGVKRVSNCAIPQFVVRNTNRKAIREPGDFLYVSLLKRVKAANWAAQCWKRIRSPTVINDGPNESDVAEGKVNPNVNFLEGKCCPACGSYGPFEVEASMLVMLHDDGCGDAEDGSIEYDDDDSPATCHACRFEGKLGDFGVDE